MIYQTDYEIMGLVWLITFLGTVIGGFIGIIPTFVNPFTEKKIETSKWLAVGVAVILATYAFLLFCILFGLV